MLGSARTLLGSSKLLGSTLPILKHGPATHSSTAAAAKAARPPLHLRTDRPDAYRACFIDAAGTLLSPSEPAAEVYQRYAAKYQPPNEVLSQPEILTRFRKAYSTPWAQSTIRYVGDGRPFWRFIVQESTLCTDEGMFEEVYQYYARPEAWNLAPGATDALIQMRKAGVLLAVVSNFDTRLRPILDGLGVAHLFDAIIISAEVGVEKPNRCIFEAALEALGVQPEEAVHVGDDRRNDLWGARDAGVHAWLWGPEEEGVSTFSELAHRVINGSRLFAWEPE